MEYKSRNQMIFAYIFFPLQPWNQKDHIYESEQYAFSLQLSVRISFQILSDSK